jgi:hypothetical protein
LIARLTRAFEPRTLVNEPDEIVSEVTRDLQRGERVRDEVERQRKRQLTAV